MSLVKNIEVVVDSGEVYHYQLPVEDIIGLHTAEQYGAKADGVTDDTAAIQACLDAHRGVILASGRTYICNGVTTTVDDIYILGGGSEGTGATILKSTRTNACVLNISGTAPHSVRERIRMHNFAVDGNGFAVDGIRTCASQSNDLFYNVKVERCTRHGIVHTRGWSTFARAVICRYNGENGIRLEGDNNNTHWEGMSAHNGTVGLYVRNSAAVSYTGSLENNGEEGAVVLATTNVPSNFVNTVTSNVTFDSACYFESNGTKNRANFAEVRFGGDNGVVRDCSIRSAHIGVGAGGVGVQISSGTKTLHVDGAGIYNVGSPLAYVRYSGAYTSFTNVLSADCSFSGLDVSPSKILAQGYTDDGSLGAYVLAGGSQGISNKDLLVKAVRMTDANNTGTYLERIYRGAELISERGIKPNVQVWNNAVSSAGFHSFAIAGTEVLRMNTTNFQPRTDNTINLGAASTRWGTVYAGTGTINTSDERLKTAVFTDTAADDAERLAAAEIKQSIYRFKFNDAVEAKAGAARIHFGVGAQTVAGILRKHGLNPEDYAFWCYDEWDAELDAEGNEVMPAGNRYGIRYEELCMFLMMYL